MRQFSRLKDKLSGRRKENVDSGGASLSETTAIEPISTTAPASYTPPSPPIVTSSNHESDPWFRAFEIFQSREPELSADYKKHLVSSQDGATAAVDLLAPRDVEYVVNQLLEKREKQQWQVALLGKDIKIRKQVQRLAKFLLWSDLIVKDAVSAQPYKALAWCSVSLLLPLLTSGTIQNEAMLKGFNSIGDVKLYWDICEKTYLRSAQQQNYQDLVEPLAKLYSYIIEYQARVICHLSRAQLSRAWQDVKGNNDWDAKVTQIKDLSSECSNHIPHLKETEIRTRWGKQLQHIQESQDILNDIRRILEDGREQTQINDKDQEKRNLLQILVSDYNDYKDFNPQRVEGTCEWFFGDDRFHRWRDSSTSSLLWVSAGPGCGKSVLSRALIDEQRLSTNITTSMVCHFFFKEGDTERMYSCNALCAILHQLFTQDPTGLLIENALPSQEDHGKSLPSMSDDLNKNFEKLWSILMECAKSSDSREIICLLDALDECDAKERENKLIKKLTSFYITQNEASRSAYKLKFLITSRPYDKLYDNLEASFQTSSGTATYLRFDGDDKSTQISQEINLVIDAKIPNITRGFKPKDRDTICACLKSMEHRTYLWLHLTLDIIEQSPSKYGRRRDVEDLLSELPSQISEAYEKILDRSQDEKKTEALLQIVLAAERPLELDEANIAMALALASRENQFTSHTTLDSELWPKENFGSIVKNWCGLFISVYESKLSFIHQTAREFLISSKQQGKWQGRFNMAKSHSIISLACLDYLLLPDPNPAQDYPDGQSSFLSYAAIYWPLHYASQEDNVAIRSRKDARMLCNMAGDQIKVWAPKYFGLQWNYLNGWTDLVLASYLGIKLVVEDILCRENANINLQGGPNGIALQAASAEGHEVVVKLLLEKGAEIDSKEKYGRTPLSHAAGNGHEAVVRLLLGKGADVNMQDEYYGSALQVASAEGHEVVVRLLLEKGAEINSRDKFDRTPLSRAAEKGHEVVVKLLLEKGAEINSRGKFDRTPLSWAAGNGHVVVVKLLLEKGAEINSRDKFDLTPLSWAARNGHVVVVKLLLEKGVEIDSQSTTGRTPLSYAAENGHEVVVRLLLEKGAEIDPKDKSGQTPLSWAARYGHEAVVKLLTPMP